MKMESSYQTISKMPMSAIANIISTSKSSNFQKSASSSSLHNNSTSPSNSNPSTHSHHNHNHQHHSQPNHSTSHHFVHGNSSSTALPNLNKPSGALSINLSRKGLSADQLLHLSSNFPLQSNIATLKLGFNDFKDEGAIVISSLLQKNRSITCLDLGFCNIGDEGIEAIANALMLNQTLKILYLSGNLATSKGFKSLGNALATNKTLQALYLTGNAGRVEGAKFIAKGLKFNRALQKLFLNGNKIECDGATTVADTLLTNHALTCLNLSDNNIGDSGLMSLSEAMANHRQMQELELSFNKITSVGMGPFIDSLIGYHSLQRLLLDNNKLGDAGAKSLSLALPHMRLMELNVGFNEIGIDGLLSVIGGITNTKSLLILILSGNTIDNTVAQALANFLMINTTLQSVHIDRTNLTSVGDRFIATGIASNRASALRTLTGFELGKVLHLLGSPAIVCDMSNEQALKYLSQMWKNVEKSKSSQTISIPGNAIPAATDITISPKSERKVKEEVIEKIPSSRGAILAVVRRLKEMPFNNADLWGLYQYFYSPPVSTLDDESTKFSNRDSPSKDHSTSTAHAPSPCNRNDRQFLNEHDRPDLEDSTRPMKRPVNKFTVSRISNYHKIKSLLEECKSNFKEEKSLLIMRQVKLLEESLNLEPEDLEKIFFEEIYEV